MSLTNPAAAVNAAPRQSGEGPKHGGTVRTIASTVGRGAMSSLIGWRQVLGGAGGCGRCAAARGNWTSTASRARQTETVLTHEAAQPLPRRQKCNTQLIT